MSTRKPSPIERIAEVTSAPATHVAVHQREADPSFAGVERISAGLMHVQRGRKLIRSGDELVTVGEGELAWIAPGTRVDVRNQVDRGEYRAEGMLINPALLVELHTRKTGSDARFRAIRLEESPGLMDSHRRCVDALVSKLPVEVIRFRVLEVLAWLVELGVDLNPGASTRFQVKRLFVSAPARAWKLREVARALAMSEDTLHRRLTKERSSFQSLLTEVRMDRAPSLRGVGGRPQAGGGGHGA
ncbi:MAG: hypothetical protein ACO1OB_10090, partial [Archangium sp.]